MTLAVSGFTSSSTTIAPNPYAVRPPSPTISATRSSQRRRVDLADEHATPAVDRLQLPTERRAHGPPALNTVNINWRQRARQLEKGFSFEQRYTSLTYKPVEKVQTI